MSVWKNWEAEKVASYLKWVPPTKGPIGTIGHYEDVNIETSHGPALAAYKDKLYMAWKGKDNENIYYSYYPYYNSSIVLGHKTVLPGWETPKQVPNGLTSNGPALAAYDNKLYMVWKALGNDEQIWYSVFDGTKWSEPKRPEGGAWSARRPALAVYKNKLYMAWRGMGDDFHLWFTKFDNINKKWLPQKEVFPKKNYGGSHGPALAADGYRLTMVWKGNTEIWFSEFDGTYEGAEYEWGTSDGQKNVFQWLTYYHSGDARGDTCDKIPKESSLGPALAYYDNVPLGGRLMNYHYTDTKVMVGKGKGNDSKIWFSEYLGEPRPPSPLPPSSYPPIYIPYEHGWSKQKPAIGETSDTPALASFDGKLFMAWKGKDSDTKIRYSYCGIEPYYVSPIVK